MKTFPQYELQSESSHGFFTPGRCYPCLKTTDHGNGGIRGFYWDDIGMVRMVKHDLFATHEKCGEWIPPEAASYMPNRELQRLSERWGFSSKQTIYNWQRGTQPIRWHDLVLGAELPVRTDAVPHLTDFVQSHGVHLQEIAVRWGMQQFGNYLKIYAAGNRTAYFWDLWRGMLLATGQYEGWENGEQTDG